MGNILHRKKGTEYETFMANLSGSHGCVFTI